MTLEKLLADLRDRGVALAVDGDNLRIRAPRGVLTAADRAALAERKREILAILRGEPAPQRLAPCPPRRPERSSPTTTMAEPMTEAHGRRAGRAATRRAGVPESHSVCPSHNSHNSQKSATPADTGVLSQADRHHDDTHRDRPEGRPAEFLFGTASVTISGRAYTYFVWSGETLAGDVLGFDTETALIVPGEVPPLALASASSGAEHCVIHPDRVGEFIRRHGDRHLVFHNVAFDFWTVAEHLVARGETAALGLWGDIAEADRMHDTMFLDELIRLARTDAYPRPRDLGVVALEYADLEIDKDDPFRLRYGEIIGRDWATVERGFFDYAVKDPIATLAAYRPMRAEAIKLMEAHGYDPSRRP
jgi:hypothetical protein